MCYIYDSKWRNSQSPQHSFFLETTQFHTGIFYIQQTLYVISTTIYDLTVHHKNYAHVSRYGLFLGFSGSLSYLYLPESLHWYWGNIPSFRQVTLKNGRK